MGGRALVEADELIGLVSGEASSASQESVEPVPLVPVCGDEDVEVHGLLLLAGGGRRRGPDGREVPAWQTVQTGRAGVRGGCEEGFPREWTGDGRGGGAGAGP